MKKYYEILGLNVGANKQEIKKAFNKLSKELDPKKNDNQDFFIEETKKLQEAYDKLMNSSILSTKKVLNKSIKNEHLSPDKANNEKPNSNQKKKSFFSKENAIIVLLIILTGHNIYLQILVSEAAKYSKRASSNASEAASYASDAANYASDAANYASDAYDLAEDASNYARQASNNASNAANYAWDAAYN
jgi:curved DNA-binding protein CbpA